MPSRAPPDVLKLFEVKNPLYIFWVKHISNNQSIKIYTGNITFSNLFEANIIYNHFGESRYIINILLKIDYQLICLY